MPIFSNIHNRYGTNIPDIPILKIEKLRMDLEMRLWYAHRQTYCECEWLVLPTDSSAATTVAEVIDVLSNTIWVTVELVQTTIPAIGIMTSWLLYIIIYGSYTYLSSKNPGFHDVIPNTFVDFTSKFPDMVPTCRNWIRMTCIIMKFRRFFFFTISWTTHLFH